LAAPSRDKAHALIAATLAKMASGANFGRRHAPAGGR